MNKQDAEQLRDVQEQLAEAWDEGFDARGVHGIGDSRSRNPYRAYQPAPTETAPACTCGNGGFAPSTEHRRSCPLNPSYDVTPNYDEDPRLAHALANPPGPRGARLVENQPCRHCGDTTHGPEAHDPWHEPQGAPPKPEGET